MNKTHKTQYLCGFEACLKFCRKKVGFMLFSKTGLICFIAGIRNPVSSPFTSLPGFSAKKKGACFHFFMSVKTYALSLL